MNFIPVAVTRAVAGQVLLARKNSPTILFAAGLVSMVGSTVLACRATLKLEEVLDEVESNKRQAHLAKERVDSGVTPPNVTYTDDEMKRDLQIITGRGLVAVGKLYAPAVILGGVGIACLTKSHHILQERNAALTAAFIAVDTAFKRYRERVVDRFGEDTDRELRYDFEEVDVIDEETGKVISTTVAAAGDPGMYARWFDEESSGNWTAPPFERTNLVFLRNQQNAVNDLLHHRGHVFLNEVYGVLGLSHTSAGSRVGWVYDRNNDVGDNFIDFGCWRDNEVDIFNGRDGAILLDFNVDGEIWQLIDARNARKALES